MSQTQHAEIIQREQALQSQLAAFEHSSLQQQQKHTEEYQKLQSRCSELELRVEKLVQDHEAALVSQTTDLKQRNGALSDEIAALTSKLASAEKLARTDSRERDELFSLRQRNAALVQQLDIASQTVASLEQERQEAEARVKV